MKAAGMIERPRARQDLLVQEVGREGLLYDRDGEVIHILNVTALEVWRACNGDNDLKAIESTLMRKFTGVTQAQAEKDIAEVITEFGERGLLDTRMQHDSGSESEQRLDDRPQRLK